MAKYDPDDIISVYFIVKEHKHEKIIQGWTHDKKMAEVYMEFHNCKKFHIKKITGEVKDIASILEENLHDEINLYNITTRDNKHHCEVKSITIPATQTEILLLNDETNTLAASMVRYSYINGAIPYLKDKYKKALMDIGLLEFINKSLHERKSPFINNVEFDQLILLYKLFADNFG